MSQNDRLEELFQRSFESHEYEYDPKEWEKLNKSLNGNFLSRNWIFILGAALIILTITSSLYLFLNKNSENKDTAESLMVQNNIEKDIRVKNNNNVQLLENLEENNQVLIEDSNDKNSKTENTYFSKDDINNNIEKNDISDLNERHQNHEIIEDFIKPLSNDSLELEEKIILKEPSKNLGNFITTYENICVNSTIEFRNINHDTLFLMNSGKEIDQILPGAQFKKQMTEPGKFSIKTKNRNVNLLDDFVVLPLPSTSLAIDQQLNYEKGLPSIRCEISNTNFSKIEWQVDRKLMSSLSNNSKVDINLFKKGSHDITVKVRDEENCVAEEFQTITIQDEYNLLSVNAFSPNSLDFRNKTFMPYALVIRDVIFKMSIFDPDDGGIVFESEDKNFPWEGIDKRTGKMIDLNKAYIWRVSIENPLEGENPIYQGTIVRF